jgi:hypothetical protein
MVGIPPALDSDAEDVAWALQTAEALWKRNERIDAVVWLRRAAQAAGEAEDDDRALALAREAAELAEWLAANPAPSPPRTPSAPVSEAPTAAEAVDDLLRHTQTDEVDDLTTDEVVVPPRRAPRRTPPPTPSAPPPQRSSPLPPPHPRVPSAAEKHAGMLDPWAENEAPAPEQDRPPPPPSRPPPSAPRPVPRPPAQSKFDVEEVVTSAPPMVPPAAKRAAPARPPPPPPAPAAVAAPRAPPPARRPASSSARVSRPPSLAPTTGVDLTNIEALSDLPDDAREAFARAAKVQELSEEEELTGFALALVLDGAVDLAGADVETPAQRLAAGAVLRTRGTVEHVASMRIIAASEHSRVAMWEERAVEEAFRTCPWVEDELRAAGDQSLARVGITMGALGERLDPSLREQVLEKLNLRVLGEHEVFAARGKPIPGLLVVGAGELELVGEDGAVNGAVVRTGEFLFPNEVLRAGVAPTTARAGKGGAVVLVADRGAAQELLVTCPPLLEIFAGS